MQPLDEKLGKIEFLSNYHKNNKRKLIDLIS